MHNMYNSVPRMPPVLPSSPSPQDECRAIISASNKPLARFDCANHSSHQRISAANPVIVAEEMAFVGCSRLLARLSWRGVTAEMHGPTERQEPGLLPPPSTTWNPLPTWNPTLTDHRHQPSQEPSTFPPKKSPRTRFSRSPTSISRTPFALCLEGFSLLQEWVWSEFEPSLPTCRLE